MSEKHFIFWKVEEVVGCENMQQMVQESVSLSDVIHGISCCATAMTFETWSPMEVYSLLQYRWA
jgi:hypothetical protein